MILKHKKTDPRKDKDSQELDRAMRHVHGVIHEITKKTHHQK